MKIIVKGKRLFHEVTTMLIKGEASEGGSSFDEESRQDRFQGKSFLQTIFHLQYLIRTFFSGGNLKFT
jgi:hypothetical protein